MKIKVLFTLLILSLFSVVTASDLNPQKIGEITLLTLRLDTKELFSKDKKFDYRFIFEVLDEEGKTVYIAKKDIIISQNKIDGNERIIIFLETDISQGDYTAYLKLNNKLGKDKKEEKFNFSVEKNQQTSDLYMYKEIDQVNFEVLAWEDIKKVSYDVYLYQIYIREVENLCLVSENLEERKVIEFSATKKLKEKIKYNDFIENFTNNYIEFYLAKTLYQVDLKVEHYLNSFQKKYSWEDQLNQIKYIVNDKKWKEINHNNKMSTAEKVLAFWESNNPKDTQSSTLQDVFYNRILQADRKFSVHRFKNGWQTDRGRIFIKFGEPDEISVDNNPIGKYPTQTWYYYRLNKTFIFYDRSRIEDYKLYNKEEEYDF